MAPIPPWACTTDPAAPTGLPDSVTLLVPMESETYPNVLPIFPLAAPLLLPGTVVPLMASEERYRNLLDDALAADGYVALLQPLCHEPADAGEPGAGPA